MQQSNNIFKQFYRGETSTKQELQLLNEVTQNTDTRKALKAFDEHFDPFQYNERTEKSWQRFKKNHFENQLNRKKNNWFLSLSKYAAVFILAFVSFYITSDTLSLFSDSEIQYFETFVPKGQKTQLTLPDGSIVHLNSESTIRYASNFNKNNRDIELLNGEAYFTVTHNTDIPFDVKANDYTTRVHGTEFNVMAYKDFKRTETTLVNGKVEIRRNDKTVTFLKPGEKIIFDDEQRRFIQTSTDVDADIAWKNNQFVFKKIPFTELAKRLERWYDITIEFSDPALNEILYTGKFKNKETIWQVMDVIKATTPIDYKLKNRKLTINIRRKCQ
ncbi:FecR family protein [Prolixibacteraceae bacterium JC049]|nr:FecR family protein [Prolixibacteraceae bacterium JC049]